MITVNGINFRNFAEQIIANKENDEKINELTAEMEETVQALSTQVEELTNKALEPCLFNIKVEDRNGVQSEYWGITSTLVGDMNRRLPDTIVGHSQYANIVLNAIDGILVGNYAFNQLDYERYLITEISITNINMPTVG